jgi:hypothetical protein
VSIVSRVTLVVITAVEGEPSSEICASAFCTAIAETPSMPASQYAAKSSDTTSSSARSSHGSIPAAFSAEQTALLKRASDLPAHIETMMSAFHERLSPEERADPQFAYRVAFVQAGIGRGRRDQPRAAQGSREA